ncbi:PqqD family protein [Herbiconiux sp.]|uniref:PqqD family protein n=1 Tax=Herbiconiux sp. TaxID=1871186 RepID=UPI0025C4EC7D|nr:PqqD family protein [Herbiconiux sp.]
MTGESTDANSVWQVDDDVAIVASADSVTVLDLAADSPAPLVLSATAAEIWHAIDGRRSTDEIVSAVAGGYGIDGHEVRADVIDFLTQLRLAGVIRRRARTLD